MKTTIFTLFLALIFIQSKAQIFTQRTTDEAITITPKGIQSKFNATPNITSIFIGQDAGRNTTGGSNIALGYAALLNNTTGLSNISIGAYSLRTNVANYGTTAIGYYSMYYADNRTTGVNTYNTAVGTYSLQGSSDPSNNTGRYNTAIGSYSMVENSTGEYNLAMGYNTLSNNTTGHRNVAVGVESLLFNTTGTKNIGLGSSSLRLNTVANENLAIGFQALFNHTGDNYSPPEKLTRNLALGYQALFHTDPNDQVAGGKGIRNLGIGYQVFFNNTKGEDNTIIGYQAGFSNTIGSRNVFIGFKAGYNHDADDVLVIENSDGNRALIRGDFANDKVGINRLKVDLDSRTETLQVTGEAFKSSGTGNWIIPSDRRLKENIVYLNSQETLNKVLKMKGVSYNWIDKSRGRDKVFGFIAQDLQQVFPENVKTDKEGFLSASYGAYDPMIIESIKALKELIDEQRKEINYLKNKVDILSAENKQQAKLSDK